MENIKIAAAKAFEFTKEGKVGTLKADSKLYVNNLPEGITADTVKAVEEYNRDYVHGVTTAFRERALDEFGKDKELEKMEGSFKMGVVKGGKLDLSTERVREFTNFLSDTKEKTVKEGYTTIGVKTSYGGSSSLKALRDSFEKASLAKI